jgi:ABC-type phosphate transport system permease subunit
MRNHPIILLFCGVPAIAIGLLGLVLFRSTIAGVVGGLITFGFLMHLLWMPKEKDSK